MKPTDILPDDRALFQAAKPALVVLWQSVGLWTILVALAELIEDGLGLEGPARTDNPRCDHAPV